MFKAIFWDNDGVLVDTEHLYFRATTQVLARVGVRLSEDLFRRLFLIESRGAWHLAEQHGVPHGEIDSLRKDRNRIYRDMLHDANLGIDGVEEVLKKLNPFYKMAVVTSSHREDFQLVHRSTSYLKYFDFVLTREDYGRSKPDPEPYLRALEVADVEAEETLAIEDSERGLIAAKRAGLPCWVIPTGLNKGGDFSLADRVLAHIGEVTPLLLEK
jgi:HAD superfamily hydrolase (TIGR01509 family)